MVHVESITATLVYTYNADGLRVAQAQSVSSVESVESVDTFTWDWATPSAGSGQARVPELLSDGESLYLIGYDTLGWQSGTDWTFVLPDALGSVRQETDAVGAVSAVREWSPYGEEIGGSQTGLGFTGEWYDANVGLTYLRARWLDVGTGRFTQVDPWAGDRRQSLTLNPYLYVIANPLNAVDPSGWYHKDVHLELTKRLVLELGSGWPDAEKLAETIAEANQHVDDALVLSSGICRECHFCDKTRTDIHINEAINSGNPYLFGATMHQFQDFYSHWNEGYRDLTWGHLWDSWHAGVSGSPRSPGGKSHRLELLLENFFLGGHFENYGEIPLWVESPYPAHPRDEVIAEIRSRNPGIDLNGLNDDDLIDLYLRRDWEVGDWPRREQERSHFGLDPDAYIGSSLRDTRMRQTSRVKIAQFLLRALNPCAIDWSKPSDDEIKMLLTK
ncbi:MAG: RHS repeat-associated core domain-containing protein [Anaerolineae bacterium]